jgi:hypothetical protein
MANTAFMNLSLPTVTVTLGPTWANQINEALERIDSHDHSNGNGVRITPLGLNINSDLEFNNNRASDLELVKFRSQSTSKSGASNVNSIYSTSGDLYFTNGNGVPIQITSGGALISTPGAVQNFERQNVASDLIIGPSDTFVYLTVDTTAARQITLPLASAVSDGRIYIIKDKDGQALDNNITVVRSGSDSIDGETSQVLNSNYGSWMIVGDGGTNWYIS